MRRIPFEKLARGSLSLAILARVLLLVALPAWSPAAASDAERAGLSPTDREPTVVLISMDGTRPADLVPERLPALLALAERGARAERLVPQLPSNTFPNHVSLVTGVPPWRHGIVDNRFVDPERGLFQKQDIPGWIEVEPLWSLLEREGIVTASFHWVGSEGAWPGGRAPRYWKVFAKDTGEDEKVDQILAWLDLPPAERPRFVSSWFHGADHAGHHHGPDSPEAIRSLRSQSDSLQRLVDGIAERGAWETTTLIVVSDHGMMVPERRVDLGAALDAAGIEGRVIGIGGFVSIRVSEHDAGRAVEVARDRGLAAWRREDAPPDLPVGNPRFGPVVALAPSGTAVVYDGLALTGFHGHRPEDPEMAAILVAVGRGVVPGSRLPAVSNLDVAPTVLALLDVAIPERMEGRPIAALSTPSRAAEEKR